MHRSRSTLLHRLAVAVAVLAILPVSATPAFGAQLGLDDRRGDMWRIQEGSTDPQRAPRARHGDFVHTSLRHSASRVVVRSRFAVLERSGRRFRLWVEMRTGSGREFAALVETTPRRRAGRTALMTGRGRDVACPMQHRVDYARDRVRVSLPRACLGNPRFLRFRVFNEFSRRNLRFALLDNPHNRRATTRTWTAPVRRG